MKLSKPQKDVLLTSARFTLMNCGVGSGKSFMIGVLSALYAIDFPKISIMITANTHGQLNDSTMNRVRKVWRDVFGLVNGIHYVVGIQPLEHFNTDIHDFKKYDGIISFINGSVCYYASMENYTAVDGKEVSVILQDEVGDTREDAIKDTILPRLREGRMCLKDGEIVGVESLTDKEVKKLKDKFDKEIVSHNPWYGFTSPKSSQYLVDMFNLDDYREEIGSVIFSETEYFHKEYEGNCVVICSSYHNQENLPDNYIEDIIKKNPSKANAVVYGDPFIVTGQALFSSFNRYYHVGKFPYIEGSVVHTSFDQNRLPYNTAIHAIVIIEGKKRILRLFAENCIEPPHNDAKNMGRILSKEHGNKYENGLFLYGDPSGRKKTTSSGNDDDYFVIKKELMRFLNNRSDRIARKHPPVLKSVDFINAIFNGNYENIDIQIDESLKELIKDLQFLKQGINGKKIERHKEGWEKYGHTSDALRYIVCVIFDFEFERDFLR